MLVQYYMAVNVNSNNAFWGGGRVDRCKGTWKK